MSKFVFFAGKAVRWLGGGLVGLVVGVYVLAAASILFWGTYFVWGPYWCITSVQQRIADVSGFDFEIDRGINCDEAINVLVSKPGESKKAVIFRFTPPDHDAIPTITSIGDGTVKISIPRVPFIYCRKDKWETLTVKYDIGVVDYSGGSGEPDEC